MIIVKGIVVLFNLIMIFLSANILYDKNEKDKNIKIGNALFIIMYLLNIICILEK